jgi:hypothetical protein
VHSPQQIQSKEKDGGCNDRLLARPEPECCLSQGPICGSHFASHDAFSKFGVQSQTNLECGGYASVFVCEHALVRGSSGKGRISWKHLQIVEVISAAGLGKLHLGDLRGHVSKLVPVFAVLLLRCCLPV